VFGLSEKNVIIEFFNNIITPIEELVEKVKFHSYWWLRANNVAVALFGYRLMSAFV